MHEKRVELDEKAALHPEQQKTAEYRNLAQEFELLAMFEQHPNLKASFEKQARAYGKLAAGKLSGPPKISN